MKENINYKINLKIKTIFFIIVSIILLSITILRYLISENNNNISINYTTDEDISQENEDIVNNYEGNVYNYNEPLYTVKEHNGVITVFMGDEILDIMLSTVKVENLPESDQEIIYAGVDFDSYKDLIAFLEDFE